MNSTSSTLTQLASNLAANLYEFLKIVVLGILIAFLSALPWFLRTFALLGWLISAIFGLNAIQIVYAPFTDEIPLLALKFALIFVQVAWLGLMILYAPNYIWGGLTLCAITVGGFSWLALTVWKHWLYADLFFRVLPPALFSVLLIYETIRLRSMRRGVGIHLSTPAFQWLGRKMQSRKGGE
jgi:hypothetical protein